MAAKVKKHPSGECIGISGRQGQNAVVNGSYARIEKDHNGYPAYVSNANLFLYYDVCDGGNWRISTKLGNRSCYCYNEDDPGRPDQVTSSWFIYGAGDFEQDPNIKAVGYTLSEKSLSDAPQRVVIMGREGANDLINGGYVRRRVDFQGRPCYEFKESDPPLCLYFQDSKWKIAEGEPGGRSFFAYANDLDAVSPDLVDVPWYVAGENGVEVDKAVKCVRFDAGMDNDLAPSGELKSQDLGGNLTCTFSNSTDVDCKIYWVDYDGQEKEIQTVPHKGSCQLQTTVGHGWRVRRKNDNGLIWEQTAGDAENNFVDGGSVRIAEPTDQSVEGEKFKDPEFPPGNRSLNIPDKPCEWIRGSRLLAGKGMSGYLFDKVEIADLLQGQIGNCWLIAAIASVAEFPQAIEDLFESPTFNPDGKYVVRLYDISTEQWVKLTIDDYVPCEPKKWWQKGGVPLFAQPADNELWCLILEKAFAKFVGSYGKLCGGYSSYAWQAMTGCKEQLMWKKDPSGIWKQAIISNDWVKKNPRNFEKMFTYAGNVPPKSDVDFFKYLLDSDQKRYLMSASIGGDMIEKQRADGLVERHAYSLIQVAEFPSDGVRILQLRNPWGNDKEWNGAWSDNAQEWDRYPHIKKAVKQEAAADGAFWMPFDQFSQIFKSVYISPQSMPLKLAEKKQQIVSHDNAKQVAKQQAPAAAGAPVPALLPPIESCYQGLKQYYCTLTAARLTDAGNTIQVDFTVRGDGSLGPLQKPNKSQLHVVRVVDGQKYQTISTPPQNVELSTNTPNLLVGRMDFSIEAVGGCEGVKELMGVNFKFGEFGYTWAKALSLLKPKGGVQ